MKITIILGEAEETDIKIEPYGYGSYELCYLNSNGEGKYNLLGFDAPVEDDNVWRFWVESGDEDGSSETNKVDITNEEKEYIQSLYYTYINSLKIQKFNRLLNGKEFIMTREYIDNLFKKIEGLRFYTYKEMENWFKEKCGKYAENVFITECVGVNSEIKNGSYNGDYSTDCTFGENIFGMDYADFTLDYIRDNSGKMLITYARWN